MEDSVHRAVSSAQLTEGLPVLLRGPACLTVFQFKGPVDEWEPEQLALLSERSGTGTCPSCDLFLRTFLSFWPLPSLKLESPLQFCRDEGTPRVGRVAVDQSGRVIGVPGLSTEPGLQR